MFQDNPRFNVISLLMNHIIESFSYFVWKELVLVSNPKHPNLTIPQFAPTKDQFTSDCNGTRLKCSFTNFVVLGSSLAVVTYIATVSSKELLDIQAITIFTLNAYAAC